MIVRDFDDFDRLRTHFKKMRSKYPMFGKDVERLQSTADQYCKQYSLLMIEYKRSKSNIVLSRAQEEINKINDLLKQIERIELLKHLTR